jgi:hypothetical protein
MVKLEKFHGLGFYGERICGTSRSDQAELLNHQFHGSQTEWEHASVESGIETLTQAYNFDWCNRCFPAKLTGDAH